MIKEKLDSDEITETFYEKELKINQCLGLKTFLEKEVINCMLNGKVIIIHLIVELRLMV